MSNDNYHRDPQRKVRISDALWRDVLWAVKVRRDRSVSYVIRESLTQYVRETRIMERDRRAAAARQQRSELDGTERRTPRRRRT